MVHAAGRDLYLFAFNAKHRTDMLAVRALDFHVLFDLRHIDHGITYLPLMMVLHKATRAEHPSTATTLALVRFRSFWNKHHTGGFL